MANKAKVLAGLKFHCGILCELGGEICPYFAEEDCSRMLMEEATELLKDSEPVVRCKNCMWWDKGVCTKNYILCDIIDCGCNPEICTDPDWYCAEGEKR